MGDDTRRAVGIGVVRGWRRWRRGLWGLLSLPWFLLGRFVKGRAGFLDDPAGEPRGMTFVFTGIQGESSLEHRIALGLADAGVPGRIEVIDWTTRNPLRLLYHLRAEHLGRAAAEQAAARIAEHRAVFPDAPVFLVGYSGGAYLVTETLRALPEGTWVTAAALLAAAVSPGFDSPSQAARTERGLWSYWSPWDVPVLGTVTVAVGNCDGPPVRSAGLVGFNEPEGRWPAKFHQIRFSFAWLRQFHYGGHLGYASRVWVGETVGPTLLGRR